VLRAAALVPLGAVGAACGAGGGAAARPRPASSAGGIDVRSYGAVGDGSTDDTAALERALAALRPGATLTLPAGHVFRHAQVLTVTVPHVTLTGGGTLSASAEATSALQLLADDITLSELTLAVPVTTRRWSTPAQHRLFLGPHTGVVVRDVTVTGSAAAGVFAFGAQHFTLEDLRVADTRADGIHMTYGSAFGAVTAPQLSRTGDDGVAVVSYLADGTACHDITVDTPVVATTTGGRGLSVVGGHDVAYRNVAVSASTAAGVYLACEGAPYDTFPTTTVQVAGGTVTGANTDPSIDQGAVLVYCGRAGGQVSDVTVSGLTISGTRTSASRQIGAVHDDGGGLSGVTFSRLRLAARPQPYEGNVPASSVRLDDVVAGGVPVHG
jgi:hypothetical protein